MVEGEPHGGAEGDVGGDGARPEVPEGGGGQEQDRGGGERVELDAVGVEDGDD